MKIISRFLILVLLLGFGLQSACSKKNEMEHDIYQQVATPTNEVLSPSGDFKLVVKESEKDGMEHWYFTVKDTNNKEIFISNSHYRTRDALIFCWDSSGRIWVYSGDLGTFIWQKNDEQEWEKFSYSMKLFDPPEILKRLKPQFFN